MIKKMLKPMLTATALGAIAAPALAETPVLPPKLVVAISVDQLSSDLFAEYRPHFTGGFLRLQQGAVFPSTYHAHAATETCPGHATLLTGAHPSRSGIIANNWFDLSIGRADKKIYCSEDPTVHGSDSVNYTTSPVNLDTPTLGDRMKTANPRSRVFAVSGKDRGAVMMGGHTTDQAWWWRGKEFVTFVNRTGPVPVVVQRVNAGITAALNSGLPAYPLPELCQARLREYPLAGKSSSSVGTPIRALPANASSAYRNRPELDEATLEIAGGLVEAEGLGKGVATDLLAVSLSVTDYIGHRFGPGGPEMCTQIMALDAALGRFFARLDATGVPYAVMLSADHGGHDIPERNRAHGIPDAARIAPDLTLAALNSALGFEREPAFFGEGIGGDLYISPRIRGQARARLAARAKAWLERNPQVAAVFNGETLATTPIPAQPPESWTLAERAAASYRKGRSGDLVVLLAPRITPIADPTGGYVATHGSPWDYDRRVPAFFWWSGISGFEQPNSILTVDLMPSIAGLIDLPVKANEIDGQCRDLDSGPGSTCE